MPAIALALIDDDPIIRESLLRYFGSSPDIDPQLAESSVEAFLQTLQSTPDFRPDILLLDIQLPGMSGIAGIPRIREYLPEVDIIMLTTFEDSDKIFAALCAGACSYLSKQTPLATLANAVRTVHKGGSYMSPAVARKVVEHFSPRPSVLDPVLTQRQQEVVQGIVDGLSYKMIGSQLGISLDTVRTHIMHIYRALNINSKAELIRQVLKKNEDG